MFYKTGNVVGDGSSNEKFPASGARNCAGLIVGISTASDDRAIANASKFFVGHSTGRCCSGNVAMHIASDCANGSEFAIAFGVIQLRFVGSFNSLPLIVAELIKKVGGR